MSNYPSGNAANVLVGPARLLLAVLGSTLPTLDGTVNPIVWAAAWKEVGYTEDGTVLAYNPTVKDIVVDEEMAPINKILDAEKATVSAKLAEATLDNLNRAISASLLSTSAADATHAQLATVDVGTGTLSTVMLGFEGVNQSGLQRVFIAYKAIAQANVTMTFRRSEKTVMNVEFGLLADSSQAKGKRLFKCVDILAPHS